MQFGKFFGVIATMGMAAWVVPTYGEVVHLSASGSVVFTAPGYPIFGEDYASTMNYDTSSTSISSTGSSVTFPAFFTVQNHPDTDQTVTLFPTTTDPSNVTASEIEFEGELLYGGDTYTDYVDIYAAPGTFSSGLPTTSQWATLIGSGALTVIAHGTQTDPTLGLVASYTGPVTLAVPEPASVGLLVVGAGILGMRKRR